jgi:hypothetical protein
MNSDSNSEIAALRNQMSVLFFALIVVSGTLTSYVYIQARHSSADLKQAEQINETLKKNEAAIGNFAGQLVAFGQAHPDFQSVLKKYGLTPDALKAPVAAPKK